MLLVHHAGEHAPTPKAIHPKIASGYCCYIKSIKKVASIRPYPYSGVAPHQEFVINSCPTLSVVFLDSCPHVSAVHIYSLYCLLVQHFQSNVYALIEINSGVRGHPTPFVSNLNCHQFCHTCNSVEIGNYYNFNIYIYI